MPPPTPGAGELCDGGDNDCDGAVPDDEIDDDGDGLAECEGDCDDSSAVVYPGAEELCDGADGDCDGVVSGDELDDDGDGQAECAGDCDDGDTDRFEGAAEACDGLDNDCDGLVPDDEVDADADGVMVCGGDCDDADPASYLGAAEACDGSLDNDCDGLLDANEADVDGDGITECEGDCDDGEATVYPGAPELCDSLDNDCGGDVDEGVHDDLDTDGYSICDGDCDDGQGLVYPGAIERCNGADDDCDGVVPEDEADVDGDGYWACDDDCDDGDAAIHPGAAEVYDGADNDCDGSVDEGTQTDDDGDGISEIDGDCDDGNDRIRPGMPELCDGLDNDCDGVVPAVEVDGDGDGLHLCEGDCDDADPLVNPWAVEVAGNGVDEDCDGVADVGGVTCDTEVPVHHLHIQDAIDAAWGDEVICVHSGIYFENLDFRGKGHELLGLAGPRATVIDGSLAAESVITMNSGEPAGTLVEGLTLTGGSATYGGGVYVYNAEPTLRNLIVTGKYASSSGGGLRLSGSNITCEGLEVVDNVAEYDGGGFYINTPTGSVSITQSVVAGNSSGSKGGGVHQVYGELWLSNSFITRNSAWRGGGLAQDNLSATVYLDGVVIAENSSESEGGGIYQDSYYDNTTVVMTHSIVAGNSTDSGGGIYAEGYLTLDSSVFWDNYAVNASDGIYSSGPDPEISYCDSWDHDYPYSGFTNPTGTDGNISEDPEFINTYHPDPLLWDLHLEITSQLIDAGDPASADPDSTTSDMGIFGGPLAGSWDLDRDGYPLWWQPGDYNPVYAGFLWDCDDSNPGIHPGAVDPAGDGWDMDCDGIE